MSKKKKKKSKAKDPIPFLTEYNATHPADEQILESDFHDMLINAIKAGAVGDHPFWSDILRHGNPRSDFEIEIHKHIPNAQPYDDVYNEFLYQVWRKNGLDFYVPEEIAKQESIPERAVLTERSLFMILKAYFKEESSIAHSAKEFNEKKHDPEWMSAFSLQIIKHALYKQHRFARKYITYGDVIDWDK